MARKKRTILVLRRRRRKRRFRSRRKVTVSRNLGPLAIRCKAKLIYHEAFTLNPPLGGLAASKIFSVNDIYQHQGRGRDQLFELYRHATVIAARATIYAVNSDGTYPVYMTAMIRDNNVAATDPKDIMENRYIKVNLLSAKDSGRNQGTIRISCNPNAFLTRSKPLSDGGLKNSVNSGPTEQAYLHINAFTGGGALENNGDITFRARIEYTCIFFEPKQPTAS